MRSLLALTLFLPPALAWCWTAPQVPAVSVWDDSPGIAGGPADAPGSRFGTVRIDTMVSYLGYLFQPEQGLILQEFGQYFFLFAYNDDQTTVRTVGFFENQLVNPAYWCVLDIAGAQWLAVGSVSPAAYYDGWIWSGEVTYDASPPARTWHHQADLSGVPLWSPPWDVGDYLRFPITEAGPNGIVYMCGRFRPGPAGVNRCVFKSFDGETGNEILAPVVVFPDTLSYAQGYENSQLHYRDGLLAAAVGGYRTNAYTDPTNPLLVVYKTSTDGGQTWSDAVWLDQTVVPDMPGAMPGIEGHWSNSFFDGLIDDDGDLHFMSAVVDSGCFNNASYVRGLYDVHEDNGVWTASLVTDGTDYMDAGVPWNPRSFLDGDTYLHAPSLAWHPGGIIFATWADIGHVDPADSSFTFDIWFSWSADEGNTWHNPSRVTDTPEWNESFPRLLPTTTDDYAYVLTMYEWADGPMDMIQFWPIVGAPDPAGTTPTIAKLSVTPNPLAGAARVSFSLASPEMVEAGVYNARGELVETLVRGSLGAGDHSLVWNANDASPGVYLARVNAGEETASERMVLVR